MRNLTDYPLADQSEPQNDSEEEDADMDVVVTTASDASSGDGKIAASSVDGEDDVVDVTTNNTLLSSPQGSLGSMVCSSQGQTDPPKWLDPSVPLPDEYNNIFDICYYHDKQHSGLPGGLDCISDDINYPSILMRVNRRREIVEEAVTEQEDEPVSPVSEEDEDVTQLGENITRMNEESSEDDDDLAGQKVCLSPFS